MGRWRQKTREVVADRGRTQRGRTGGTGTGGQDRDRTQGAAGPNKWILILNRWSHKIRSACRYVVKIQPSDKWLLDENMIKEELLRQRNIREISQAQEAAALIFPWNVFLKVFRRHKWAISPYMGHISINGPYLHLSRCAAELTRCKKNLLALKVFGSSKIHALAFLSNSVIFVLFSFQVPICFDI